MKRLRGKKIKLLAMLLMIVLVFSSLRTTSVNADVVNDEQDNHIVLTGEEVVNDLVEADNLVTDVENDNNEVEDIEVNEDEEYVNQIQNYVRDLLASQDLDRFNYRETTLNLGGSMLYVGDKLYYTYCDSLFVRKSGTHTLLETGEIWNLYYKNDHLFYTTIINGKTVLVDSEHDGSEREIIIEFGAKIKQLYFISESDILYLQGNAVHYYNLLNQYDCVLFEHDNIYNFIPSKSGIIYALGKANNYSVCMDDMMIVKNCSYYAVYDKEECEYLKYDIKATVYHIKCTDIREQLREYSQMNENKGQQMTDKLYMGKVYSADEMGLTVELNETFFADDYYDIDPVDDYDYYAVEEKRKSKDSYLFLENDDRLSKNSMKADSLEEWQINIVKRARQMMEIKWTPLKDIKSFNYDENQGKIFPAGVPIQGLLYAQNVDSGTYVPQYNGFEDFLAATKDVNSKLYTSRGSRIDKGYDCPYYGCDCSSFVSYAWGLDSIYTTWGIQDKATLIAGYSDENALAKVIVGDALNRYDVESLPNHVILIAEVDRDVNGELLKVVTYEQTTGIYYKTCRKEFSKIEYEELITQEKYSLYRCEKEENVKYTHNCVVPIDNDYCEKCKYIKLNKSSVSLNVGEQELLAATVNPTTTISWTSSNPNVASVIGNGLIVAKTNGYAVITATANGMSASCMVTVTSPTLSIDKTNIILYKGEHVQITATASPASTVTWTSSDTNVARVSGGLVTASAAGTTVITARANGLSASCTVTVKSPTLEISPTSLTIYKGKSGKITASATPVTAVIWKSSDASVATVSEGKVTGVKAGTVTITATANGVSKTCKVTVNEPTLTLNVTSLTIYKGNTGKITATVSPSATVTWKSSDTGVATVSGGTVTGKKAGTATITATANGISKTCTVTVKNPTLTLSPTSLTIYKGNNGKITATAKPSTTVTWKSSDTSVATVSGGTVTGKKAGTATITATANGISKTCTVTVKNPTLTLSSTSLTIYKGNSGRITATASPSATVSWTSSNTSVATVSGGTVTGKKAGTATITATANGISKSCTVTVKAPTLTISPSSLTITKGSLASISATASPSATITWRSSNTSVATVSGGTVTGKKAGTATITATANGISKTCTVTVLKKNVSVNQVDDDTE